MWKEHKNGNMTTHNLIANLKVRRNNDKQYPILLHYHGKQFRFSKNNLSYYGSHIPR